MKGTTGLNVSIYAKMFVFGEVQDPNQDTVNLVEDIVRSQIIELVRPSACISQLFVDLSLNIWLLVVRSFKRELWQTAVARGTFLPKTSSFSFVTTEERSIASGHTSHGRTYANMRKTLVATAVVL